MPICSICGKYEKSNKPVSENLHMNDDEIIDKLNSIGCTSFVICSDCSKKYVKLVNEPSDCYKSNSRKLHNLL